MKMENLIRYYRRVTWVVFWVMPATNVLSQTPTHYPTGKNPEPFTFWNVFFYIVIPVLMIAAWILIRRSQAKRSKKEQG